MEQNFKVIGYYPSWVFESLDYVNFDALTHIYYAFAIPTEDGTLRPLERPLFVKELIDAAHSHGIKVLLSAGGWDYKGLRLNATFAKATDTPEKTALLVQELLGMCDAFGFDGLDIDWEYPAEEDGSDLQYISLMQQLSSVLHAEDKLLTTAVFAGVTPSGEEHEDKPFYPDAALDVIDWINIMAYDGGDGIAHSGYEFAVNCAAYWHQKRALSAEKVILGVPFYGRPTWLSYNQILKRFPEAYRMDMVNIGGEDIYYNGVDTIRRKTAFAKETLGGIMIWEITQDAKEKEKSLLQAIHETLA